MRQIRLALRMLFKTPFVTTIAVLSLALGIGANAAIFSMFDQLLLRPLPVNAPQELVNLTLPGPKHGSTSCGMAGDCDQIFSYAMFRDIEERQTVLSGVAAHSQFGASISVGNEPFTGEGLFVSGSFFTTLGIAPALGRFISPDDDSFGADNQVAVISYLLWQDRFGGRTDVIGQTIQVNGKPVTLIGVAPEGFDGVTLGSRPIIYTPISSRVWRGASNGFEDRRSYWIYVFGRLKPGVSIEAAKAGLTAVVRPILHEIEGPLQIGMSDVTMQRFLAKEMVVEPGARGQSSVHGEAKPPLIMLLATTGVVLLIACANIANLLLARGAGRATEMGVRLALGASRRQLLTQLLTESVVLALMGGVVSLIVASWTLSGVSAILPADISNIFNFRLQPSVVFFSAAVAVATGLLFGLFPALHSTRADLITAIRAGAGQIAGGRAAARFRSALITVQIALSMALLVSAGLFLKSLVNVSRVDLGVKIDNMVAFSVSPISIGYDSARSAVLMHRIEEELRELPGVSGVTSSLVPLLRGSNWGTNVKVQGFLCEADTDCNSRFNEVGAGYFSTFGVRMKSGREFTDGDRQGATRVAVVNQTFADKFGLGTDAVGKFMARGSRDGGDSLNIQIVGLIDNMKYSSVKDTVPPVFYTPWMQSAQLSQMYYYVRTPVESDQLLAAIPALIKRIDPGLPVENIATMEQQVRDNVFLDRMISILSASFAAIATLLAAVGLYGVLAYSVSQRTREIGVRMALGADGSKVQLMVLRQVIALIAVGAVIGIAGALALGRAAMSLLYELEGHDPTVFVGATLLLVLIALVAGFLPARRASKTDPMHALRYD